MPSTAQTDPPDGCAPATPASGDFEPEAALFAVLEADTAATLDELRAQAHPAAEEARAANTERPPLPTGDFCAFCTHIGRKYLPAAPETLTL